MDEETKPTSAMECEEDSTDEASSSAKDEQTVKETRAELLSRHQKEKKELQNREIALKKAAAKGSKAEQKAKKKQVEEEISKLEAKMLSRHAKELASLSENGEETASLDGVLKALSGLSASAQQGQKPSKAQKRRDKKAQQDAAREQRIQEEQSNVVSNRMIEDQQLEGKLRPLGLTLKEIKPDGHCLYRAVEDQLSLYPGSCRHSSYQELRELAASYMRSHADEFIPFMGSENDDVGTHEARFERYCKEVESTAAWGGQLELGAIAHSLKKHIIVFSGDLPEVEMGKEYETTLPDGGEPTNPSLRLSYHRYAFGLGEHYNSVVPLVSSSIQIT